MVGGKTTYVQVTPGNSSVLVGSRVVALLGCPVESDLVAGAWDLVDRGGDIDELATLIGGESIGSVQDLCLAARRDGRWQVVVRGAGTARAPDGSSISGEPEWDEGFFEADRIELIIGTEPQGTDGSSLRRWKISRGLVGGRAVEMVGSPSCAEDETAAKVIEKDTKEVKDDLKVNGDDVSGLTLVAAEPLAPPQPLARPSQRPRVVASLGLGSKPGDHDGMTVSVDDVAAIRALIPDRVVDEKAKYLAVRCPSGHLNPVHAHRCRICDSGVSSQPFALDSLELGNFVFEDGRRFPLERPMLIGRAPRMSGAIKGVMPELITVMSPESDVSRTHLEVRLEGWQVLVIDRGSTNGTVVYVKAREPQKLRADQPFILPVGARVSLAEEAEFTFEATR